MQEKKKGGNMKKVVLKKNKKKKQRSKHIKQGRGLEGSAVFREREREIRRISPRVNLVDDVPVRTCQRKEKKEIEKKKKKCEVGLIKRSKTKQKAILTVEEGNVKKKRRGGNQRRGEGEKDTELEDLSRKSKTAQYI